MSKFFSFICELICSWHFLNGIACRVHIVLWTTGEWWFLLNNYNIFFTFSVSGMVCHRLTSSWCTEVQFQSGRNIFCWPHLSLQLFWKPTQELSHILRKELLCGNAFSVNLNTLVYISQMALGLTKITINKIDRGLASSSSTPSLYSLHCFCCFTLMVTTVYIEISKVDHPVTCRPWNKGY